MRQAALALFGTDEPVPRARPLRCGALSLDWCGDRLQALAADSRPVWDGVHFLLRDAHWRTPPARMAPARLRRLPQGWQLTARGHIDAEAPVDVHWLVTADSDAGTLHVAVQAVARGPLSINRLGLCLLHPCGLAGQPVQVTHDDGRVSRSTWPALIPAWPPFTLVRAIRHRYAPGAWADARFEGDVFETEDQRNNGDDSFKTYARSNFMPRPWTLRAGEAVRQSLTLRLEPRRATSTRRAAAPAAPIAAAARVPVPLRLPQAAPATPPCRVALALCADDLRNPDVTAGLLAALRPAALHLCLDLPEAAALARPMARLMQTGAPAVTAAVPHLRLDLVGMVEAQAGPALATVADAWRRAGLAPQALAVLPSSPGAVAAARRLWPGLPVGGGTGDFFVQLSRQERLPALDFLCFTHCPIVHGADDVSVMAGLRSLGPMLQTLARRWPGVAVQVGPSGLAARHSPLGDRAPSDGARRVPLAGMDPRNRGLYGAAWMLGHVAALAAAGAQAVTISGLSGCNGLLQGATPDRALAGPAAALLAELIGATAWRAVPVPDGAPVAALYSATTPDTGPRLLLANLSPRPLRVQLDRSTAARHHWTRDARSSGPGWQPSAPRDADGVWTLQPHALGLVADAPGPRAEWGA